MPARGFCRLGDIEYVMMPFCVCEPVLISHVVRRISGRDSEIVRSRGGLNQHRVVPSSPQFPRYLREQVSKGSEDQDGTSTGSLGAGRRTLHSSGQGGLIVASGSPAYAGLVSASS